MEQIILNKTNDSSRTIIKKNIQPFLDATQEVIANYDVSVYGNYIYLFVNNFADMYIFKRATSKMNTVFDMWNSEEAFAANIVNSAGKRKFKRWAEHSKRTEKEKEYADRILNAYENYFGNIVERHYDRLNEVTKISSFNGWTPEQIDDKYWIRSMKNTTVLIAKDESVVQVKKLILKNGSLFDIVEHDAV